jgi:hypothetical protein
VAKKQPKLTLVERRGRSDGLFQIDWPDGKRQFLSISDMDKGLAAIAKKVLKHGD